MKITPGEYKTANGTIVVVEVEHPLNKPLWIGHVKVLGRGNPRGVMVWDNNGKVQNCGVTEQFSKDMQLVSP